MARLTLVFIVVTLACLLVSHADEEINTKLRKETSSEEKDSLESQESKERRETSSEERESAESKESAKRREVSSDESTEGGEDMKEEQKRSSENVTESENEGLSMNTTNYETTPAEPGWLLTWG